MITLLVDVNLDGHARLLESRLKTETWSEFFEDLEIQFVFFEEIGLGRETSDESVWDFCQERGYFLLTANRNELSADSLGATIRGKGTPESLPVFTLADADRIFKSTSYLDKVIEQMLLYLLDRENYFGTGRLFLP